MQLICDKIILLFIEIENIPNVSYSQTWEGE
jgi:hypothetical protein